jgi:Secretion system C-terminal sorting domain
MIVGAIGMSSVQAQSLERSVIGSAGTYYYEATAGSLSFTVGEAATATLASASNVLTQGFQQPMEGEFGTVVRPTLATDAGLQLYPNPAHDQLICLDAQLRALRFVVRDAAGRVVQVERTAFAGEHRFDVAELAYGPYWLTVEDADGATWSLPFIKH